MKTLEQIYAKIPLFDCVPGCFDCCGPVPCNFEEQQKLRINSDLTPTKLDNLTCLFASEKGCSVYENRPYICRLFGTTKSLLCPKKKGPKQLLSPKQEAKLMNEYIELEKNKKSCLLLL